MHSSWQPRPIQLSLFLLLCWTCLMLLLSAARTWSSDVLNSDPLNAETSNCHYDIVFWNSSNIFHYKQGDPQGVFNDILQAISERQRCKLSRFDMPSARAMAFRILNEIEASLWLIPIGKNPETRMSDMQIRVPDFLASKQVHVSAPVLTVRTGFFSKPEFSDPLETDSDILSYKIGALRAPVMRPESYKYMTGFQFMPTGFTSELGGLKSLAAGRVDLYYTNFAAYYAFINVNGSDTLKLVKELTPVTLHFGFYKHIAAGDALAIDQAIIGLQASGEMKRIVERYSNIDSLVW